MRHPARKWVGDGFSGYVASDTYGSETGDIDAGQVGGDAGRGLVKLA